MSKTHHNYYILSGAMGAGKTSILNKLKNLGFLCIAEPAREILAEQRSIEGDALPENDPALFTQLMLSRSLFQYKTLETYQGPIIFDRGIPDNLAYASLFELDMPMIKKAIKHYRYNPQVLFLDAWEEIYTTDDERKMSFIESKKFGEQLKQMYLDQGYTVIDVPQVDIDERVEFIAEFLSGDVSVAT